MAELRVLRRQDEALNIEPLEHALREAKEGKIKGFCLLLERADGDVTHSHEWSCVAGLNLWLDVLKNQLLDYFRDGL